MSNDISITKYDNGICTIERTQFLGSSVEGSSSAFACGKNKFDKSFREKRVHFYGDHIKTEHFSCTFLFFGNVIRNVVNTVLIQYIPVLPQDASFRMPEQLSFIQ